LEPELFSRNYAITNLNLATKEGKQYKIDNNDKEIIKVWDFDKFNHMKENLLNFDYCLHNPIKTVKFGEIINNSIIEQGILADVECTNKGGDVLPVTVKVKPDIIFQWHEMIYIFDIKTVETANLRKFYYDSLNYKYHWQDTLYSLVVSAYYKLPVKFIFVLVEKSAPYGVRYAQISSDCLDDIEKVIFDHHTWQMRGGNISECYLPEINKIEIGV
jgi:hypothetical protein